VQAVFFGERRHLPAGFLLIDHAGPRRLHAEDDVVQNGKAFDQLEVLMDHSDVQRVGVVGVADPDDLAVLFDNTRLGLIETVSTLMRVDLPAPFSPSKACISPFLSWRVMSSLALIPGNSLVMFSISITYSASAKPITPFKTRQRAAIINIL
jgi:hypothetical protein